MRRISSWPVIVLGLLVPLTLLGLAFTPHDSSSLPLALKSGKPRLAVVLLFDQLRGDYLERWNDLFEENGFKRLKTEGAWFTQCHYPYSVTVTGAGHASVGAGCPPHIHGIIENEWYDREANAVVNCVASDPPERYDRVPPYPSLSNEDRRAGKKRPAGVSPERLRAPSLGDAFMGNAGRKARVYCFSLKDRGAVLFGGRQPKAECYWFDATTGLFVTSTYYRDRLPSWIQEFNERHTADSWFDKTWLRLRPDLDYDKYSGPDDAPGEGSGAGTMTVNGEGSGIFQGRVFPHVMAVGLKKPGKLYYDSLYNSPYGNDLLLQAAKNAVNTERIGQEETLDLLCLSFSSNDAVGHIWGPDSQEVLDTTLRTDRLVADLLTFLDSEVGKGNYIMALTADHGVCPLPEQSQKKGLDAGRLQPLALSAKAQNFMEKTFGPTTGSQRWIESLAYPWFYLNRSLLARNHVNQKEAAAALSGWLEKQPGVARALTIENLESGSSDPMVSMAAQSYFPGRSGEVLLIPKPYWIFHPFSSGTTHGSPYEYDTHVPLLFMGAGVRPGMYSQAVTPLILPEVLSNAMGILPPGQAHEPIPFGLLD